MMLMKLLLRRPQIIDLIVEINMVWAQVMTYARNYGRHLQFHWILSQASWRVHWTICHTL